MVVQQPRHYKYMVRPPTVSHRLPTVSHGFSRYPIGIPTVSHRLPTVSHGISRYPTGIPTAPHRLPTVSHGVSRHPTGIPTVPHRLPTVSRGASRYPTDLWYLALHTYAHIYTVHYFSIPPPPSSPLPSRKKQIVRLSGNQFAAPVPRELFSCTLTKTMQQLRCHRLPRGQG